MIASCRSPVDCAKSRKIPKSNHSATIVLVERYVLDIGARQVPYTTDVTASITDG
jgi:hypothetical protein